MLSPIITHTQSGKSIKKYKLHFHCIECIKHTNNVKKERKKKQEKFLFRFHCITHITLYLYVEDIDVDEELGVYENCIALQWHITRFCFLLFIV